jgi:hypothetical protein
MYTNWVGMPENNGGLSASPFQKVVHLLNLKLERFAHL